MVQIHTPQPRQAKQSFGEKYGLNQAAGNLLQGYFGTQQRESEDSRLEELTGMNLRGIDPETKRIMATEALKGGITGKKKTDELIGNRKIISDLEQKRGLEPGSLSAYENDPKMAEQVSRPTKEPKKTQASQPIDPEQRKIIKEVRDQPGFSELDELGQYQAFTDAGVSKENSEAEAKLRGQQLTRQQQGIDQAYKAHEDFINDTTQSYRAFETDTKPKLLQMQKLASDDDLIGPTAAVFLEHLGIPLGALEDPSSELFNKLSLDLLKGLPETYGNRILKVEVENFLKTIPSLMNSASGRRMIASNMLKLGEMKEVYYNEMRNQQKQFRDQNKPLPRDFQQEIFDQVRPQVDRINNEFVKMADIKEVPNRTTPFFTPSGQIKFVPKNQVEQAVANGGRQIW